MEHFYFEKPSLLRKEEAISYIHEFYEHHSYINGTGGLNRYLDDYEGWLNKLEEDEKRIPNEEKVPAKTYFLVRESDARIVGMINIRLALNEKLKKFGGHIGYSIRPTERKKGYNKINLYLGLKVCQSYGIKTVLRDADKDNPASWKTMEALGGKNTKEFFYDDTQSMIKDYEIDVDKSINTYSSIYEAMISK